GIDAVFVTIRYTTIGSKPVPLGLRNASCRRTLRIKGDSDDEHSDGTVTHADRSGRPAQLYQSCPLVGRDPTCGQRPNQAIADVAWQRIAGQERTRRDADTDRRTGCQLRTPSAADQRPDPALGRTATGGTNAAARGCRGLHGLGAGV